MSNFKEWTKLPTGWVQHDSKLKTFKWSPKFEVDNAGQVSALMLLIVIAHHTNKETGFARLSYSTMSEAAGLSRALVARGLKELEKRGLIVRDSEQIRGTITLKNATDDSGWGKLPANGLYKNNRILAFDSFKLRSVIELDALKIYFLVVAMRDNKTNRAYISYDKITEYTGVRRNRIRPAISTLAANSLVSINHVASSKSEYGYANEFHLPQIKDSKNNLFERSLILFPSQGDDPTP